MKTLPVLLAAILFLGLPLCAESPTDLVKEADLLLDMMEYRSAAERYRRAQSEGPPLRDVRKKMAYAQYQLGSVEEAFFWLKEELNRFPDNEDAYDLLTCLLFKRGGMDKAGEFMKQRGFLVELSPENTRLGGLSWFILGMSQKENKNDEQAELCFKNALDKGFDAVRCYVQLINLEHGRSNWESVRRVAAEAVRALGPQAEFLFLLGLESGSRDSWSQAADHFQKALILKPDFKEALFNLAAASYNSGDFSKASAWFQDCLAIDPSDEAAKKGLECSLKKLGPAAGTDEPCPSGLALSRDVIDRPDREYTYRLQNDLGIVLQNLNAAGLSFIQNGRIPDAVPRFRNALKINPECPEIHFNLGMVMLWQGESGQAEHHALMALRARDYFGGLPPHLVRRLRDRKGESLRRPLKTPVFRWTFSKALEEGNGFLDAYDLLGRAAYERGEVEKARLAFEKVLELDDEDAVGHCNLGAALLALGDEPGAEKEWRKAIKHDRNRRGERTRSVLSGGELQASVVVYKKPVAFYAHKSLGEMYQSRRQLEEAVKEYENAVELETGDPEPHLELGRLYLEKGNRKKAAFHLQRYLYLGGKEEAEAKELLEAARQL